MLLTMSKQLSELIKLKMSRFATASFFVKFFMIIFASSVVGVSQFAPLIGQSNQLDIWSISGIIAAIIVFCGGIIVLFVDQSAEKELAIAHEAIELAREREDQLGEAEVYIGLMFESLALGITYSAMRAAIEQSLSDTDSNLDKRISDMLTICHRQIEAAASFDPGKDWTLCVFRATTSDNSTELELVHDIRSVPCERIKARKWPTGVGPTGVAHAQGHEVILDDLLAPELGSTFTLPQYLSRDHDQDRFRSLAAIPVLVGRDHFCWGVVTATLNTPGHFSLGRFEAISVATDTVRAIAEMVALLAAIDSNTQTTKDDKTNGKQTKK